MPCKRLVFFGGFQSAGSVVTHWVECATSRQEVMGSIPAVAQVLLVGSVSV